MLLAKGLSCYEVLASVLGWLDYYNAINLESKREWNFFIENLRYCMNMQSFYMIYHGPTSSFPSTWLTTHESTFFTPQNVRNGIDRLQFGKARFMMDWLMSTLSMTVANHWKHLETFIVNDCAHDKEWSIDST